MDSKQLEWLRELEALRRRQEVEAASKKVQNKWACPKSNEEFPDLCPELASPPTGRKGGVLPTSGTATVGARSWVLGAGHGHRGAVAAATVLVQGVAIAVVGNAAARDRALAQRFSRNRTVLAETGRSVREPDVKVVSPKVPWKGEHPASGFLHGIADTHEETLLVEKIDTWDKLLLQNKEATKKWEAWLRKDKKQKQKNQWGKIWSATNWDKRLRLAYAHLKKEYERLEKSPNPSKDERWKQWITHFEPLRPRTFRTDAEVLGIRKGLNKPMTEEVSNKLKGKPDHATHRDDLQTWRKAVLERRDKVCVETRELLLDFRAHVKAKFGYDLRIQLTISNSYGYPKDGQPAPWSPWWEGWRKTVTDVVKEALDKFKNDVEFDIWNEPDLDPYFKRWSTDRAKFLETWIRGAQAAREANADVILVGPSLGTFDPDYLREFIEALNNISKLSYAGDIVKKMAAAGTHNLLPDILSWHDQYEAGAIPNHVITARSWLGSKDQPKVLSHRGRPIEIDINEYLLDGDGAPDHEKYPRTFRWYNRPGRTVHFIAALDAARVRASCHTTVRDDGPQGRNAKTAELETLDGLLTRDWKRRSTWHVYHRYAEMQGNFFRIAGPDGRGLSGIASRQEDGKKLCVLLGRDDDSGKKFGGPTVIRFTDLPPPLRRRRATEVFRIHIHAKKQDRKSSHEWPLAENIEYEVTLDSPSSLQLEIQNVGRYDALFIRLSPKKPRKP